jgi:hypothetical protein
VFLRRLIEMISRRPRAIAIGKVTSTSRPRACEGINRLISIPSSGRFCFDPISRNPRNSAAIPLVSRNRLKPNPTRIWAPLDRFIPSWALSGCLKRSFTRLSDGTVQFASSFLLQITPLVPRCVDHCAPKYSVGPFQTRS